MPLTDPCWASTIPDNVLSGMLQADSLEILAAQACSQVPVIDLGQDEATAAGQVHSACLNTGFFYGGHSQ